MSDIVKVHLLDGSDQPIDIEPLRSKQVGHLIDQSGGSRWFAITFSVKYFHPDVTFIVETTHTQWAGGASRAHRRARQIVDEEWLIRRGYERLTSTRDFSEKIGLSNAKYPDLFKRAIKKGLIDPTVIELPENTWWVLWKNPKQDTPERET